jgi:peroxiredoxin
MTSTVEAPDWSAIPAPLDDGTTRHLVGARMTSVPLTRFGQREAAERLHLPFAILSDEQLTLTRAMRLPTFNADGMTLLKRFTLVIDDGTVRHVFYPVFPPDRSASDVVAWLSRQP